jgi:hypothetical protein
MIRASWAAGRSGRQLPLQAIGNELASALGLRIETLLDLTGRLGFAETTPIGLDELARLYRYASLARILSLKPDEVVAFSALSGGPLCRTAGHVPFS